jgi:transposase
VAFEAAYGWGWLVELLEDYGFVPHLVHPLRCKAIASARLKNDKVDAAILAQLLRADLLPEAWIAPAEVRQLRALLRHRVALVRLCTQLRNRIHAVVADHGYDRPDAQWTGAYWTGPGRAWLEALPLPAVSRQVIADSLAFIDAITPTIERLDQQLHARAKTDPRVKVLTTLPGVGEFTAMVLLAEIGDITRFSNARRLASWAGLTPTVRGSDQTVHHGHIWKAGLTVRAVGARAGRPHRQAEPRVHRHLPGHHQTPREADRHHRGGTQAADPCLPPARRGCRGRKDNRRDHTRVPHSADPHPDRGGSPNPGRARSRGMSRPSAALELLTEQPGSRTHGHGGAPAGAQPNGCL